MVKKKSPLSVLRCGGGGELRGVQKMSIEKYDLFFVMNSLYESVQCLKKTKLALFSLVANTPLHILSLKLSAGFCVRRLLGIPVAAMCLWMCTLLPFMTFPSKTRWHKYQYRGFQGGNMANISNIYLPSEAYISNQLTLPLHKSRKVSKVLLTKAIFVLAFLTSVAWATKHVRLWTIST